MTEKLYFNLNLMYNDNVMLPVITLCLSLETLSGVSC